MSVDHYENFPVPSILMPKRLRKPVAAIIISQGGGRYCR